MAKKGLDAYYFEKVMQDYNQNRNGRSLRKNCSHMAAQNVAFMYSLYESCKLNDLNFFDYINDVLPRLTKGENDYKSLIPCNYKPLSSKEEQKKVA